MDRCLVWLFVLLAPVFVWSWFAPHDRFTRWLKLAPAVCCVVLFIAVQEKFPLSNLLLTLIGLHCVVLLVGGHYTYAKVPLLLLSRLHNRSLEKMLAAR